MDKAYLLPENIENQLLDTIASLIEKGKKEVASNANSVLTMLYWNIGEHINRFIIENKRAEYGQQIIVTLSRVLVLKYGNSFEEKNLRRMMQFAEKFSDSEIVVSLSRQLGSDFCLVCFTKCIEIIKNLFLNLFQTSERSNIYRKSSGMILFDSYGVVQGGNVLVTINMRNRWFHRN